MRLRTWEEVLDRNTVLNPAYFTICSNACTYPLLPPDLHARNNAVRLDMSTTAALEGDNTFSGSTGTIAAQSLKFLNTYSLLRSRLAADLTF